MDFDRYETDGVHRARNGPLREKLYRKVNGAEGVKLEEQVLVTESGVEWISRYPFDDQLLAREI